MKYNFLREATESLLDNDRTKAFQRAIGRIVKPGDTVLDCGTGTGILAILAAKAGAREVIAVEQDKKVCELAYDNVKSSGFTNINVVHGDAATQYVQADVVIVEMLDTMLITGEQVKVANTLINRGVITGRTKVLPLKSTSFFEPVCYDFEFYECHLPMIIQSRNADTRCLDVLGQCTIYHEVYYDIKTPLKCHYEGKHVIHTKGWLNALKFTTITHLTNEFIIGSTSNLCIPTYVPVHEMSVKPGDVISVQIDYHMSGGYENLNVIVS